MSLPFWIPFNGLREIQRSGVERVKIEVPKKVAPDTYQGCFMKKLLLYFGAVLLFASCTSTRRYAKYDESTANYLQPKGVNHVMPLLSDISVDEVRISYQQVFVNNLTKKDIKKPLSSSAINYMKDYSLTQAAFNNNADIIVCPLIDVKTSDDYKTITVTVTGYPGRYSNFRTCTAEDFEIIRMGETEQVLQKLTDEGLILPMPASQVTPMYKDTKNPNRLILEIPATQLVGNEKGSEEVTPIDMKEVKVSVVKEN